MPDLAENDDPPPIPFVLAAASRLLSERALPASLASTRGIALAEKEGVTLIVAQLDELGPLRAELLRIFASDLLAIGPLFRALDALVATAPAAGLPVLVLRHGTGGLLLEQVSIGVRAAGGSC